MKRRRPIRRRRRPIATAGRPRRSPRPPYPFTEWPYGGATSIGVTPTQFGRQPTDGGARQHAARQGDERAHIQIYGWINPGANLSTNTVSRAVIVPAAYVYTPNTATLDQAVLYIERVPDTVQTDHIDWGFRVSGIYGENYRYTTAYGVASYQLLGHNLVNGYDLPMIYGELYLPQFAQGLVLRMGRFISSPISKPSSPEQLHVLALDELRATTTIPTTASWRHWR